MRGQWLKLSPGRRLVIDFLYFAAKVPAVVAERRMNLLPLLVARRSTTPHISWQALFIKAYALTAVDFPELRRAYVKLPWPHFCEYPTAAAVVTIEREIAGEKVVFNLPLRTPTQRTLAKLDANIRLARTLPVRDVLFFRRWLAFARLPMPLRRLLIWIGLNWGRQRANYFGSFLVTSYAALGAEALRPLSPATTSLTYGLIDETGSVAVRVTYDHRVLDGATMARALFRLEAVLNGQIAAELARPTAA